MKPAVEVDVLVRSRREAEGSEPDGDDYGGIGTERNESSSAFRSRPFVVFMAGCSLAWTGDWMDLASLNWAVLSLTDSAFALGVINACRLLPIFALSLPAGVLADRFDRRRLLIGLQCGTMSLTLVLGLLTASHGPFWVFATCVTFRSVFEAMATPVRNALFPNYVPRAALASAVAVQAASMNLARVIGPAIAGVLLTSIRIEHIFWINSLFSLAAILGTLLAARHKTEDSSERETKTRGGLREAFSYVAKDRSVQSLLILAVVPMVFGFPYSALMPFFARDLLGLGPSGFGTLLSVTAAGALVGSVWLSMGQTGRGQGRRLVLAVISFGVSLLLFSISRSLPVAAVMMFLVGLSGQLYRTSSRIALQRQVPDALRGRILSLALMDRGLIPLGTLMLSLLAEPLGAMGTVVVMGGGCAMLTLILLVVRPQIWSL